MDQAVAGVPVAPGWSLHVTRSSDHGDTSLRTSAREPSLSSGTNRRSRAQANTHPPGTPSGNRKRTNARALPLGDPSPSGGDPASTFRTGSLPLFEKGLPSSIQLSARAGSVMVVAWHSGDVGSRERS